MNRAKLISVALSSALIVAGCGADDAPSAKTVAAETAAPVEQVSGTVGKKLSPYKISYNVVGTPVVGSPLTVQLQVRSSVAPVTIHMEYGNRDASALVLGESQPATVSVEWSDDEAPMLQQVTVVPQREGRHYLIVSATMMTPVGQDTTSIAVPIQVGEGGRELIEQGRLETTESGETVRVLPGN